MDKSLTRRGFIGTAALAIAALGLVGCQQNTLEDASDEQVASTQEEGKWITGGCIQDCGGRCLNKALVVNGMIVRQKTDDTHPDSPEYPQERACNRGRAFQQHIYGADRIKYPMKRKHWESGGGDKSLRGRDEWERISWDEALSLIADEMQRIKKTYGNRSILVPVLHEECMNSVLHHFGGYMSCWDTGSLGSYTLARFSPMTGMGGSDRSNDRFDLENCETIIMFALNPAWSSPGNSMYYWLQAKAAGTKFFLVDPFYNDSAATLNAEWMPIRVGTDTALMLAMAYTLLDEDDPDTNPLIDWDFVKRCTIGFDADSMPEGENPEDNFKDYVLGTYDGSPKTPEWAEEICGLPAEKIRSLARELRKDKKVALVTGWANGRTTNSDSLTQIFLALGAMGGHMGKSGHMTVNSAHSDTINGGPALCQAGSKGLPTYATQHSIMSTGEDSLVLPITDKYHSVDIWQNILDGKGKVYTSEKFVKPVEETCDIRMIFNCGSDALGNYTNSQKGIEAYRTKIDFVVTLGLHPCANVQFSDIVLPVNTRWERVGEVDFMGARDFVLCTSKVIEPLYESKSDWDCAVAVMEALGMDSNDLFPFSPEQAYFNALASTTVCDDDGVTYVPMATITEDDIAEWGVEGTPQEGKKPLSQIIEDGMYQVERHKGDNFGFIALEDFVKDPEANPITNSPSGKIEFFSRTYADTITNMGFMEKSPLPTYMPGPEGYEETFSDWDNKVKGEYPYQIYSAHSLGRAHTTFSNNPWLRESWTNPIVMNTQDAADNGIADGDTVLVSSQHGRILRHAYLSERIMPGVMMIYHGSHLDYDDENGVDRGGSENILCGCPITGQGTSAYNSILVKVEKWTGESLASDLERPKRLLQEEGE